MKKQALAKGQRVEVHSLAGTEYGTVTFVISRQVDVHMDDDTHCWFPMSQVHAIEATS